MEPSRPGAESLRDSAHPPPSVPPSAHASTTNVLRQRSDESWVELSSQPSSSSLSSSTTDEIVTTGLRVRHVPPARRRRRPSQRERSQLSLPAASSGASSSQEEYDESESEEDHVMTSSNEQVTREVPHLDLGPLPPSVSASGYDEDEDDEDENATALGPPSDEQVFTPQPNAFSHPPSSHRAGEALPDSYFARPLRRSSVSRHSYPSRRTPQHTPYHLISPSYQADHDAALRASLSTLLSCAAAARGLSKQAPQSSAAAATTTRPEASTAAAHPTSFQIVPESVVMKLDSAESPSSPRSSGRARTSSLTSSEHATTSQSDKAKRKATASPSKGSKERVAKKTRSSLEEAVSPTLLTWVVSAGVVVIVSAIGFSAGYAMGREAGLVEAGLVDVGDGTGCGKEAVRGLRRFRWGTTGATSVRVS